MPVSDDAYFIWSNEHRAWWRPNSCGYTDNLAEAGTYSQIAALIICGNALAGWREGALPELPIRAADLKTMFVGQIFAGRTE